ncbi:MAG: hypothetical protein RL385_3081 [Pseudomonadota bacterium]|jgi:hypothetical protein
MLETRPLFVFEIQVATPLAVSEQRRVIPLGAGRVSGLFSGTVLPGGADWQSIGPDGVIELSAHYLLERDDGARVEVRSTGVRAASPAVLAALQAGEALPASAYYFRTHMRFTAHAEDLRRLNHVLAVSVGERHAQAVRLEVFEVL